MNSDYKFAEYYQKTFKHFQCFRTICFVEVVIFIHLYPSEVTCCIAISNTANEMTDIILQKIKQTLCQARVLAIHTKVYI